MTCEVLARCLENCQATARSRGLQLPAELVVLTDNTVRENKCQTLMMFLAHLQQRACFQSVAFVQHIKGHTHNILDQLFGVISRAFQFCDYLPEHLGSGEGGGGNSSQTNIEKLPWGCRDPCLCSGVCARLGNLHEWIRHQHLWWAQAGSDGQPLLYLALESLGFDVLWQLFCFTVICLNFVSLHALKFKNPPPCKSGPQEKMFRGMTWRFYSLAQLLEGCWALSLTGWTPS